MQRNIDYIDSFACTDNIDIIDIIDSSIDFRQFGVAVIVLSIRVLDKTLNNTNIKALGKYT